MRIDMVSKAAYQKNNPQGADKAKVAQEFEAMLVEQLLKTMAPPSSEGLWSNSQAKNFFHEMKQAELAKNIAKNGGLGLSAFLERALNKLP